MQGVGETVRGTLNNEIDTRFPRSNSQKAAAAHAKNQAVLEEGNREMARVSMRRSQDRRRSQDMPYTPQAHPSVSHEPMPQQLLPGPPGNHRVPSEQALPPNHLPPFTPPPPSGPSNSSNGGFSNYGGSGSSNEMSQMPPSFSPESSAPPQKQGGFRKLIKRRPVSGGPA